MSLTDKRDRTEADRIPAIDEDFEAIFIEQWSRICHVLYRLLGDWADAEDTALETFTRLHQRPPKEGSNLNGWLYRVAMNLGFNELRRRKRRQRYEDKAGEFNLDQSISPDPELALEKLQERERVRMTLAGMKPRSAKLLILRHSGFTYREIAGALDIRPGSVGKLLSRAENEFKKKYRS
jgi:RNA polymerase sigma factor (sigma-70 family)